MARNNGILISSPDLRDSLLSISKGLDDEGLVSSVVTTIAFNDRQYSFFNRIPLINKQFSSRFKRRVTPAFLDGKIRSIWFRELIRILAVKLTNRQFAHTVWRWADIGFDKVVSSHFAGKYSCIYGMEHCSVTSFETQKSAGGQCVLRMVTAHGRKLIDTMNREADRFPMYVTPYHETLMDEAKVILKRKEKEYALADLIVANSEFVKKTLIEYGVEEGKVIAVTTGCPPVDPVGARAGRGDKKIRFLFVGNVSVRKGFLYLLEAWRNLQLHDVAELRVVGGCELPILDNLRSVKGIEYQGMLYGENLRSAYRESDVFILPTLVEGVAHSLLEALSYGLPIITTEESGAGSLVTHSENGYLIRSGEVDEIEKYISMSIEQRSNLHTMGEASRRKAGAWTVEDSNAKHLKLFKQFLNK